MAKLHLVSQSQPVACFINKVLLKHRHTHLFTYMASFVQQWQSDLATEIILHTNLKNLLSVPLQKNLLTPVLEHHVLGITQSVHLWAWLLLPNREGESHMHGSFFILTDV